MKAIEASLDRIASMGERLAGAGGAFAVSLLQGQLRRAARRRTAPPEFLPGFLEDLYDVSSFLAARARESGEAAAVSEIARSVRAILDALEPAGLKAGEPEGSTGEDLALPALHLPGGATLPGRELAAPAEDPAPAAASAREEDGARPPAAGTQAPEPEDAAPAGQPGGAPAKETAGAAGAEETPPASRAASPPDALVPAMHRLREALAGEDPRAPLVAAATEPLEKEAAGLQADSPPEARYRAALQVVQSLDRLREEHAPHPGAAAITTRMEPVLATCLAKLQGSGIHLCPDIPVPGPSDLEEVLGRNPSAFETRALPSSTVPEGSPLYLVRRALLREGAGGEVVRKGAIAVSGGPGVPLAAILDALLRSLAAGVVARPPTSGGPSPVPSALLSRVLAFWTKVRREMVAKLVSADGGTEGMIGRFAVNDLDRLREAAHKEGFDLPPGAAEALQGILTRLEALDVFQVTLRVGDRFDERYPPGKFERRTVASPEPAGKIVGFLQRAFVTRKGLPLQKGIVLVSGEV